MLKDESSYLLDPPRFTVFDQYPQRLAQGRRVTLQMLLCLPDDAVVLVNPTKDETSSWWMPPQGGAEWSDHSPQDTVLREINEELGVTPELVRNREMQLLGTYFNKLPPERGAPDKFMLVAAIPVLRPWFTLNEENRHYLTARNLRQVKNAMREVMLNRPTKYAKTIGACIIAAHQGFLSRDFIRQH